MAKRFFEHNSDLAGRGTSRSAVSARSADLRSLLVDVAVLVRRREVRIRMITVGDDGGGPGSNGGSFPRAANYPPHKFSFRADKPGRAGTGRR